MPKRNPPRIAACMLVTLTLALSAAVRADDTRHDGSRRYDTVGDARFAPVRDEHVARWAVGTFRGRNGANGEEETVTIRPDGSAELRSRDKPPRYGSFAGETLTFDTRVNRVKRARGGIIVDGAYYRR